MFYKTYDFACMYSVNVGDLLFMVVRLTAKEAEIEVNTNCSQSGSLLQEYNIVSCMLIDCAPIQVTSFILYYTIYCVHKYLSEKKFIFSCTE